MQGVVKPLNRLLKSLQVYSGATVLGDGSIALIFDVLGLSKVAQLGHGKEKNQASNNALAEKSRKLTELQDFILVRLNSATKHAIKGLTEALAAEFAPQGVRAADVLPGIIDTGMLAPETKAMLPADGPLRPLPAADVADTVWQAYHGDKLHWYLPSELAAYDVEVTANPESTRDRRIAGSLL